MIVCKERRNFEEIDFVLHKRYKRKSEAVRIGKALPRLYRVIRCNKDKEYPWYLYKKEL